MHSICDDKLRSLVSNELSRIGLFIGPSEVEKSAIQVYDRLIAAQDGNNLVLNSRAKDDTYYGFLANAVVIDIFSKTRLPNVRDTFELDSALCLLDGYLYQLSVIANTEQFSAKDLFNKVIVMLPKSVTAGMKHSRHTTYQSNNTAAQKENFKLCTNSDGCDKECEHCLNNIVLSLNYQGLCWGFRVSPELIGLNQPLENLDQEVIRNFITKACELLCNNAKPALDILHSVYNSENAL